MRNTVSWRGRAAVWVIVLGTFFGCGRNDGLRPGVGGRVGGMATGGSGSGSGGQGAGGGQDGGAAAGDASSSGDALGGGGTAQAGSPGTGGGGGAGAGGATGKVEPYFRAGSRLKPLGFKAGDLKVLDGIGDWVDAETEVLCNFMKGADGIERCLPPADLIGLFADARCTAPVWAGPAPGGLDPLPRFISGVPAPGGTHAYKVGAFLTKNVRTYSLDDAGACVRATNTPEPNAIYPLEEVPLDTFVAVTRVSRPRAPHMDALVREGEDGSYEVIGMIDPARKQPCFPLGQDVSPPVCLPNWVLADDTFAGADCAAPVAENRPFFRDRSDGQTSTVILKLAREAGSCNLRSIAGVWETAGTERAPVYALTQGTCALKSTNPVEVVRAGAAIDLNALPKLELIEVGTDRLKVRFYGFEGVPFVPASRSYQFTPQPVFLDVARKERCAAHPFADGTWRCVPASFGMAMEFNLYFASPACTGPPLMESVTSSCPDGAHATRGLIVRSAAAPPGQPPGMGVMAPTEQLPRVVVTFGVVADVPVTLDLVYAGLYGSCIDNSGPRGVPLYKAQESLNPAEVFVPFDGRFRD